MVHNDTDWEPDCAMEGYAGFDTWEYNVGPREINEGEVDGDVDIDGAD